MLGAAFAENFNVKEAMVDSSLVLFLSFIDHQLPSLPEISSFCFWPNTIRRISFVLNGLLLYLLLPKITSKTTHNDTNRTIAAL